jgi:hypothetical protein
MLAAILDRRPSGTRQRLADALGKNRSFVSQVTNPAYATPLPANHLETLFDVCHLSDDERRRFMALYRRAHPRRLALVEEEPPATGHVIALPDLGDAARNERLQRLVTGFVRDLAALLEETPKKGRRK